MSAYDLIGKSVRITSRDTMYYDKVGVVSSVNLDSTGVFVLKVVFSSAGWDYTFIQAKDVEEAEERTQPTSHGCECGSHAVGSPRHSDFCRLYKRWEDEVER